jgi:hypothetical protein
MASAPKSGYPADKSPTKTEEPTNRRAYWSEQIAKANKRWEKFWLNGDAVLDRFMLESSNPGDKYNILYSSTETIKPSLYGQTPKVEVKNRQQDTTDQLKVAAAVILENTGQYAVDMLDFDYILQNAVSDYVLPGMGSVWVRYDPQFAPQYDNDNKTPLKNSDGTDKEYLTFEGMALDYVHFKDWKCGVARYWNEVPWVSRKIYFTKKQATKRFGAEKANKLAYSYNAQERKDRGKDDSPKRQTIIEEIWDKDEREVVWFSEDYAEDVLDVKPDPLRLKDFFPCPRPLRAVWTSRSFIPKALYSQYKAQAAELDRLTERIRYLTEALKVRGLYDGSQESLLNVLDGPGNKMIPVQDWAALMGAGGITGVVQWVPIKDVVNCLTELFKQREICKNEIYEITGFSDIVRGVSKASETLGAQQIKNDWATGRLKDMQREVQRFIRDIIRLFTEIAAEHFNDKTLMLYSGFTPSPPTAEEQAATQQYMQAVQQYPQMAQQAQMQGQQPPPPPEKPGPTAGEQELQMFTAALKLIRSEKLRCAAVGIETDSTILPDEQKERQDRMQFLSSMGAFLQQAAPMAMQFPDMRGLLGGIMMFTLRTFSASRPLEKEFESFQKKLEAMPPTPPPGQEGGEDKTAQIEAQKEIENLKATTQKEIAGGKAQADAATQAQQDATKRYEIDQRTAVERDKATQDHEFRMATLKLESDKLALERTKIGLQTIAEERNSDFERKDKEYEQAEAAEEKARADATEAADREQNAATEEANRADTVEERQEASKLENRKLDIQEKAIKAKPKPGAKK